VFPPLALGARDHGSTDSSVAKSLTNTAGDTIWIF
jgi:hypothetical protein